MSDTYYKAHVEYDKQGIVVQMREFKVVRDTPAYAYCIRHWEFPVPAWRCLPNETLLQTCKRLGYKIYRIHKSGSRIAQPTQQQAFDRLKFLKRRQVRHLERELALLKVFNEKVADVDLTGLKQGHNYSRPTYTVPETAENVAEYYSFDY
jgi:hypothetical protein